jgi:hypothetical protein
MSGELVPFGKHKGQPVEVLLADPGYSEWLLAQPWFRERYVTLYQTIVNYGGEPQESPEHNQMQASFLDDNRCLALARLLGRSDLDEESPTVERAFEVGGWDVVFHIGRHGYNRRIHVECKPDLGDDFPAVLRQVKHYGLGNEYQRELARLVVLVRRHRFEQVTWEQVSAMFAASGIVLVAERQLVDAEQAGGAATS